MAEHILKDKIKPTELQLERLPSDTRKAFLYCTQLPLLSRTDWYLAGGTALALQVGHRQSVDLDFFTPRSTFRETGFERQMQNTKKWKTTFQDEGTLYGELMKVKMSFIAYPFFRPSRKKLQCGNVSILLPKDIATMKIIAISQRGRKRDFIDLYWYCKNIEGLGGIILRAANQYPGQHENINHILRSLLYFYDAENDPMPKLFFDAPWREIKKYFQIEVPKIAKKFFGID